MSGQKIEESGEKKSRGRGGVKRAQIPIRTTEEIREKLQAAADWAGRSLTQEIEQRLERSVIAEDELGGPKRTRFIRSLAARIDQAESATGKSWVVDVATYTAAVNLMEKEIEGQRPDYINAAAITAAFHDVKQSRKPIDASIGYLKAVGAVVDRQVDRKWDARGRLIGRGILPDLDGIPRGVISPPNPLSFYTMSSDQRAATLALVERGFVPTIDIAGEPETWDLEISGRPLSNAEKQGIREMLLTLPELTEKERECSTRLAAAFAEDNAAVKRGEALASRLSGDNPHVSNLIKAIG